MPNKFFQSDYGGPLRHLLTNDRLLHHIVDFRTLQVFERATTYTCLLFLRRKSPQMVGTYQTTEDHPRRLLSEGRRVRQNLPAPSPAPWNLGYEEHMAIIEKLKRCDLTLEAVASEMITGVKTGANDVFVFDEGKLSAQQEAIATSSAPPLVSPYMKAENIRRYHLTPPSRRVLYPYVLRNARTKLIPASDLKQDHPLVWDYLHENRKLLEGRQKGKLKGPSWYGMSFASSLSMFGNAKILTPTLAPRNRFTFDTGGYVFPQGAGGGTGIIVLAPYAAHYILGLLNSAMLTFFFQAISSRFQGGWYAYEPRYLRRIPIRPIDFDDPQDQRRHDRLAALAEGMLSLHKQLDAAKTPTDKTGIQRQIDATDRQIDQLVYELYELTDDEIEIVEEATA